MQSKLLRVLEDRRVRPGQAPSVKCRSIFADLCDQRRSAEAKSSGGAFAPTSYYRLNVMQIHLPLLRDRGDDVQELATIFMGKLSTQLGMPPVAIDSAVRAALASYDWPGNVRSYAT